MTLLFDNKASTALNLGYGHIVIVAFLLALSILLLKFLTTQSVLWYFVSGAPTDNGVSVTRNDQKKLVIDISHIYPNTATVTVTKVNL